MKFLLLGFGSATLWGVVSFLVWGYDGVQNNPWVDTLFWSMIGAGVVAGYLEAFFRCRLCRELPNIPFFCHGAPCR